jgi:glycosyltransferase involved in cell wall biosynthesis
VSLLRVRYWVFNYMPQWEGVSKEIASLREGLRGEIEASLVSLDTKLWRFRLRGREKRVPVAHGLPLFPVLKRLAARADINHLFASGGERWLTPALARRNGVLTVAKDTTSLAAYEGNGASFRQFRAVVVQGERDREIMRQLGVREDALRVIRPGVGVAPYHEARDPFTILFASSPLTAEHFLSRGIYLMVRAAARLPDVRFLLVWRKRHLAKLQRAIAAARATNVEIMDGVVSDMGALYDRVHATILPALEGRSFIPCPRSALESLGHGKPLLLSNCVSLADGVARANAGVAFDPTTDGLEAAIRHLRANYAAYQARTQCYLAERFSPQVHLELYRRLYQAVGG